MFLFFFFSFIFVVVITKTTRTEPGSGGNEEKDYLLFFSRGKNQPMLDKQSSNLVGIAVSRDAA